MNEVPDDASPVADLPQQFPPEGTPGVIYLKVLVPSIAAGAVIGKNGEAIAQMQRDTHAKIKLSKVNDFYPGTTERVCLIQGSLEGVRSMHNYIMDRIMEKPEVSANGVGRVENLSPPQSESSNPGLDMSPQTSHQPVFVPRTGISVTPGLFSIQLPGQAPSNRLLWERHKQVKILVPNCTAGLVIGKQGSYVSLIKNRTGAFIQVSQKSKDINLPERCITLAGEPEQMRNAVDLVLTKIAEDPQSNTCPNISYSHMQGPFASAFPTGSPFAFNPSAPGNPPGIHSHHQSPSMGIVVDGGPLGVTRAVGGPRVRSAVIQNNQFAIQAALASAEYQRQNPYFRDSFKPLPIMAVPAGAQQQQHAAAAAFRGYGSPTDSTGKLEGGGLVYRTSPQSATDLAPTYPMSHEVVQVAAQTYLAAAAAAVAMATPSSMKDQQPAQTPFVFDQSMAPLAYYPSTGGFAGGAGSDTTQFCSLYPGLESPEGYASSSGLLPMASSPPEPPTNYMSAACQYNPAAVQPQQQTQPLIYPSLQPPLTSVSPPLAAAAAAREMVRPAVNHGGHQQQPPQPQQGELLASPTYTLDPVFASSLFAQQQQRQQQQLQQQQQHTPAAYMGNNGGAGVVDKTDQLRTWLRGTGYADDAVSEIANAFSTLSMHGILNIGSATSGTIDLQQQTRPVTTSQESYLSGSPVPQAYLQVTNGTSNLSDPNRSAASDGNQAQDSSGVSTSTPISHAH